MRFASLILWLLSFFLFGAALDDGLTDRVSWDKYSLLIDGKRVFIFSAEFHYQRLPVPELWLDIFQKFKAHGLNAVSIYFFWSWHSHNKDHLDFQTAAKDIQRLLDYAKEAGLYVLSRPGPYCNAETSAGGLAHWTTTGAHGVPRTNDPKYQEAWTPFVREIAAILKRNQITEGGPVILHQIENELRQERYEPEHTLVKYMTNLQKAFRDEGLVVPFFHNEAGMRGVSWSTDYRDVGGAVNIYGLDSYPGGLGCGPDGDKGFKLVRNYHEWFKNYSFTQPSFIPEFEAGWFQPWGGSFYDECVAEHSAEFADVYYKNNLAQRVTMLNLYMGYGGTSWGHSAAPVVYTSYDYSAPIRETREIGDKFRQTKLLALFTRVTPDLLKTEIEAHGAGVSSNNNDVYTWILANPSTISRFYFLQQNDSSSRKTQILNLELHTTSGVITTQEIELTGRQSKIIVTNYRLGNGLNLLYSTGEILTYGIFNKKPVLVIYTKQGQQAEFAFKRFAENATFHSYGENSGFERITYHNSTSRAMVFQWTQPQGQAVIKFSSGLNDLIVYLLDMPTAWTFFAPPTVSRPDVKADEQIFVIGPNLVRNASVHENEVQVTGDSNQETDLEVHVSDPAVNKIRWNGKRVTTERTEYGSLLATILGPNSKIQLPNLTDWRVADSLPEIRPDFNDKNWRIADKQTTSNPVKPKSFPVLYSDDYGFHSGIKLYRGYFDGKNASRLSLLVQGGAASGWNAWLNGAFLGVSPGAAPGSRTDQGATSPTQLQLKEIPLVDKNNVLTIVTDYHGHDQAAVKPAGPVNPRGISQAKLHTSLGREVEFTQWRIQGNAGGEKPIDPVRGPMNEGGLYGERLGWHLPGFNTSSWAVGSPMKGLSKAGVAFYVTKFKLNIDSRLDVPIGIELSAPKRSVIRAQIFINGYQYGRYVPHIGPQTRFPFQPGLVNTQGENTLALSLWAQSDTGAKMMNVKLIQYGIYRTGFNFTRDWDYLQPKWTEERLKYA